VSIRKKVKKVAGRVTKPVKKTVKKVGRKAQKVTAKIVKPVTGVLAAAATVIFGPVAGAAIAAMGAGIARVTGATAARDKGLKGTAARTKGRKLAKKTLKIGMLATGVGGLVSAGVSAVTGGNVLEGVGLGQVGSKLLGSKPAAPAAEEGENMDWMKSIVTENALYENLANPGQDAADSGILGQGLDFLKKYAGMGSTPTSTAPTPPPGGGMLDGIPPIVKWGAAGVVALLVWKSMRKAG
jgi:hypothetical protein